ncbi:Cytochrome P450 monooxygenase sdnE [Lachnellula suecica]|uniref:Cytochrome P450 monooxygenase sdnE n=1 Tax=Lachnellula suecica TaxID=602035 RepID=A0A8T9BTR0_9HELO|nr:Cytochrome P450 monooxygenase sdnE [Lachnellula suecica]
MTPVTATVVLFLSSWALYVAYSALWRLYFSPISWFPGPRLAALTQWYELYYDLVKGGQYVFRIGELHEKYGPIIRINPWELHVNDPDFYDELYAGGGAKRDKDLLLTGAFGNPESMIGTVSHNLHRARRAPLNKFFSRASITRLEPLIQRCVDTLCSRLENFQKQNKTVAISLGLSCFTNDVVSEYAFGTSYNYLENSADFHTDIHDALMNAGSMFHMLRIMPWSIGPMQKLPRWIMKIIDAKMLSFIDFQKDIAAQIKAIINGTNTSHTTSSHPTIFHEILSSSLPASEKALSRLSQEGQTVIGAGTETTAWALTVALVRVLSDREIVLKMLNELGPLFGSGSGHKRPTFNQLEQLPYLSGVVAEGLRLSYGVTTHMQRSSPDTALRCGDWVIPAGTSVSMSSILIHHNTSIFPDPHTFDPARWIGNPGLKRYLVSFSKGSRQCLGMNLAYAEIYLALAYIVWRFPRMELEGSTVEDVDVVADYFMPVSRTREVYVRL